MYYNICRDKNVPKQKSHSKCTGLQRVRHMRRQCAHTCAAYKLQRTSNRLGKPVLRSLHTRIKVPKSAYYIESESLISRRRNSRLSLSLSYARFSSRAHTHTHTVTHLLAQGGPDGRLHTRTYHLSQLYTLLSLSLSLSSFGSVPGVFFPRKTRGQAAAAAE